MSVRSVNEMYDDEAGGERQVGRKREKDYTEKTVGEDETALLLIRDDNGQNEMKKGI